MKAIYVITITVGNDSYTDELSTTFAEVIDYITDIADVMKYEPTWTYSITKKIAV